MGETERSRIKIIAGTSTQETPALDPRRRNRSIHSEGCGVTRISRRRSLRVAVFGVRGFVARFLRGCAALAPSGRFQRVAAPSLANSVRSTSLIDSWRANPPRRRASIASGLNLYLRGILQVRCYHYFACIIKGLRSAGISGASGRNARAAWGNKKFETLYDFACIPFCLHV
jgi:hypothetical protein